MIYIKALGIGILFGITFTYLKLPIPAPNNIPAILGIIGIYLGYFIMTKFI